MPRSDDLQLDVFALVGRLLPGVTLTSGQLAVVRSLSMRVQTELFAMRSRALRGNRGWDGPSPGERAALQATVIADLRSMLDDGQRATLEQDLQLLGDDRHQG